MIEIMNRQEIRGTGVKLINIHWISSRDVMEEFGYGGVDTAMMLAPGDIADTVWDVVNKPDNAYVEKCLISIDIIHK